MFKYPWGDFHSLNLGWFLLQFKDWVEKIQDYLDNGGGTSENLANVIAPVFNAANTYAAGDYVLYNNELYKANQAVNPGTWNPNAWDNCLIVDEMGSGGGSAGIDNVARLMIAGQYSQSFPYQKYAICRYNDKLWMCNTNLPSGGEAWNQAHWDEITVGAGLTGLRISVDTLFTNISNINTAITNLQSLTDGHKYKFVAGALRKTIDGWIYINDTGHSPINVSGNPVVETDEHFLRINFNFTASKIKTFICGCDETWSQYFNIGASVNDSYARLNIHNLPITQGGMAVYDPNNTIDATHSNGWTLNTVKGVTEIVNAGQGKAQWLTEAIPFDFNGTGEEYPAISWFLTCFANVFACAPQSAGAQQMTATMKRFDGTAIAGSDYPNDGTLRLFVQRTIPTMKLKWNNITANNLANIWFFGLFEVE